MNVLSQSGSVAGAPICVPVGELASWRPIAGGPPRPSFPDPLAVAAAERLWGHAAAAGAVCGAGAVGERRARRADVQPLLARPGATSAEPADSVATVSSALGAERL